MYDNAEVIRRASPWKVMTIVMAKTPTTPRSAQRVIGTCQAADIAEMEQSRADSQYQAAALRIAARGG